MCGIAGIVGRADERTLRRMTQLLHHRGPDDGAVWLDPSGCAGLGHRRLRIIDTSAAARQPMRSPDGRLTLVYNGEIFNYLELRRELEGAGHVFRTRSDSEVLLHAFMRWGEDVVHRLVGQFAYAVWDATERTLFAARDHLGIKPFYYAHDGENLLFASEAKAILSARPSCRTVRTDLLPLYLAFLWVPGNETLFSGISRLAPGSRLRFRDGRLETREYWHPADAARAVVSSGATRAQRAAEFRRRFDEAVRSQLVSDVPLGLLLSGGLDSTALLASMHTAGARVHALTATYAEDSRRGDVFDDDLPFARIAAQRFGAALDERALDTDVSALLRRAVRHLDEPLGDPTVVTNLALTAAGKKDMTVLLSGMGADEILAGYPRYPATMLAERLPAAGPVLRAAGRAAGVLARMGGISRGSARRARFLGRHAGKAFFDRFLGYSTYWTPEEQDELLLPALAAGAERIYEAHRAEYARCEGLRPLTSLLVTDLRTFLQHLNLENMDKTSMANSVEMRVPFLDHHIVEYALALPDEDKLRGATRKQILRSAFAEDVPREILQRKKTGYSPPVRAWVRGAMREEIRDSLFSARAAERGLWKFSVLERCFAENDAGTADHSMKLWQLHVLELWHRTFIDEFDDSPAVPDDALARVE